MSKLKANESGLVAIVVTSIVMIVLTLITIGFAKIITREQRQSLDRQLSTQAFYAAESGVNLAVKGIQSGFTANKTTCGTDPSPLSPFTTGTQTLDANLGVTIPCLLIDQTPLTLEYGTVNTTESTKVPINSTGGGIHRVVISWQDEQGGEDLVGDNEYKFTSSGEWGVDTIGVLRVMIVPTTGALNRDTLLMNAFTAFLYPKQATGAGRLGTIPYRGGPGTETEKGPIVSGECHIDNTGGNTPRTCNVEITGLSQPNYLLMMRSIYKSSTVTVSAYNAANQQLRLRDAQYMVDSTGKANDVLRRIQVRVPVLDDFEYPEFALDTGEGFCKRIELWQQNIDFDTSIDEICNYN